MFFTDSYQALRRGERRLAFRYAMFSFLVLALIILPVGFVLLRRFETAVTFHPERAPFGGSWTAPSGATDVFFETADGVRLHGWLFRARRGRDVSSEAAGAGQAAVAGEASGSAQTGGAGETPGITVIYFHGNGGNISYAAWVGETLSQRGFDVLLFDYRGYGRSDGEVGGERGLYADAAAAYRYVVEVLGVEPRRVVLYGQSLGTAAAADLASSRPCGALILESGLSSASDMAATILPWLPRALHRLAKYRLETAAKLPGVRCPVFVAHGDRDEIIPVEQGHKLFAAAPEPKRRYIVNGAGHNNLTIVGGEPYLTALTEFVNESLASGK
jgi:uncharacterized protein